MKFLLDKEIFDKLCPSYQKAIEKLEKEYVAIPEDDFMTSRILLLDFSKKYLMLPYLWDTYFQVCRSIPSSTLIPQTTRELFDENYFAKRKALYHFYGDKKYTNGFKKLIHIKANYFGPIRASKVLTLDKIIAELSCPRAGMENTLKFYEENWYNPIPKEVIKKFEKMKILYTKIMEAENDQDKWFNLVIQIENMKYIVNNVDNRLGTNLNNIKLWKLYFKFLKQHDTTGLLHLYSRYCRYFIDDQEMKDEYKEAVKKYGPIIVHWKNAYDFEKYEEEINDFSTKKKNKRRANLPITKLSFDIYEPQIFSLPKTLMSHIIQECQNQNLNILHKLHKSCKYFFTIVSYPVYYNLRLKESLKDFDYLIFYGQSLEIYYHTISDVSFDQKFFISNSLHILSTETKALSKLMANIYQCNIKYLRIRFQNFTFKEFNFLVGHENLEAFYMEDYILVDEDNRDIELHEILELMPKVTEFEMTAPKTSKTTYEKLPKLKFVNKFRYFLLHLIPYVEPYGFCEFLKNNLGPETVFIGGLFDVDENVRKFTVTIVQNELKKLWPHLEKIPFW